MPNTYSFSKSFSKAIKKMTIPIDFVRFVY